MKTPVANPIQSQEPHSSPVHRDADPEVGTVTAIWIKRGFRGPMDPCERAVVRAGKGLVGNANQGGRRQITLIDARRWQTVARGLGVDLDASARRANLLVDGIELKESRGRVLKVGNCRLLIRGETRPCERMDEAWPGLQKALRAEWGGGAYAETLDDGEISMGDPVVWEPGEAGP